MYDIENYYPRAIALLASQFQGTNSNGSSTNLQKFIAAISTESQEINTVQLQLQNLRTLSLAQGVQLNGLGQILGLARLPNQPDDNEIINGIATTGYRTSLYNQVFINSSSGTPEHAIAALKFLTNATSIQYLEPYPAFYMMGTNSPVSNFAIPPDEI